jgi:hypothetical protein
MFEISFCSAYSLYDVTKYSGDFKQSALMLEKARASSALFEMTRP